MQSAEPDPLPSISFGARGGTVTVSLYSTHAVSDRAFEFARMPTVGLDSFGTLAVTDRYRAYFDRVALRLPCFACRDHDPADLELPGAQRRDYPAPAEVRTWIFAPPHGSPILGLAMRFADPALGSDPSFSNRLLADIDGDRHLLHVGGEHLVPACMAAAGNETWSQGLALGPDFHNVTLLDQRHVPTRGIDFDFDLAQRLVARKDARSRADFRTVRLPAEANRYPGMLVATSPGASVVGGHPADLELSLVLSAVLALGSLASLRLVQQRAFEAVRTLRADDPVDLDRWTYELREMELDLSFSVEANLDIRSLVPILPVEQFHRELTGALGLERAAGVTSKMLERVSTVVAATTAKQELDIREREDHRWRL